MSVIQRAAAIVVALLVVAILGVVLLSGSDGPIGRSADPTATPTPPATPTPAPSPTSIPTVGPGATPGEDILTVLEQIEAQVIEIRGLPAPDIGPPEILTREEVAAELADLFESEYPPEDRERDNFVVRAFGLLGEDEDIGELQLQLLTDQVAGFYNTDDRRMVVVSDTGLDAQAKLIYAHEYTHALQDAAFGLDSLQTDAAGEDDRGLARLALQEGDATVTMFAWALRHLSQQELSEIANVAIPDTSGIPGWMVSQLAFPYVAGQSWVFDIMSATGGDPLSPDYAPVNAAFEDPPTSTAQIIDVQKWFDRVEPEPVEAPALAAALGEGWEEVDTSPVGQATIGIILEHFGVSGPDVEAASAGWIGDRAVVVRGPDDTFALSWRTAWETEQHASDFESAYATVIEALDFPALVTREGDTVLVVHASDTDLLRRTVEASR